MNFLNRDDAIRRLRRAVDRAAPSLCVVYGRRRCGKSTLLRFALPAQRCVFHVATQTEAPMQRRALARAVAERVPGFDAVTYPDWMTLFEQAFARLDRGSVLVVDEFPYLTSGSPEVPSLLQALWEERERFGVHLVLCGSSQQMMESAAIRYTAPLYGRADEVLRIRPLAAGWLTEALHLDPVRAVEEYAVWGGVPHYWALRSRYPDLDAAIGELLLQPLSLLADEPRRLFLDELTDVREPLSILRAVAAGAHRRVEIGARLGKPATSLSRPLARLVELDFLGREVPFGESPRDAKRALYHVADPFMRFYHRYLPELASTIEYGTDAEALAPIVADRARYTAVAWESLCRRAVARLPVGRTHGVGVGQRWWGTGLNRQRVEIDVVAAAPDRSALVLGECKWSRSVDGWRLARELRQRAQALPFLREYAHVEYAVFAPSSEGAIGPEEVLAVLR